MWPTPAAEEARFSEAVSHSHGVLLLEARHDSD
jgi:hypothetical protein